MKFELSLSEDVDAHKEALKATGFWGKRAAGVIFLAKSTGRFMLAHRSSKVLEPDTWGTWGGAIDQAETPVRACLREIKEETGYTGRVKLFPLYVFKHGSGFTYYNFLAVVPSEFTPVFNWETQGSDWVPFKKWPHPLHPGAAKLLQDGPSLNLMQRVLNGEQI